MLKDFEKCKKIPKKVQKSLKIVLKNFENFPQYVQKCQQQLWGEAIKTVNVDVLIQANLQSV